ncbi:hypothetical protein [Acaryochloris thomasi]|uniref:hypothetical protein n=1 Tax=Acaryochloris thomasi TaxID=2929456 RepID=UPI0011B54DC4|nr:hypothetical protein [Acaryochloris thomasi]
MTPYANHRIPQQCDRMTPEQQRVILDRGYADIRLIFLTGSPKVLSSSLFKTSNFEIQATCILAYSRGITDV